MSKSVGIHSVGIHLPAEVRKNTYWPQSIVATWEQKLERAAGRTLDDCDFEVTEGVRKAFAAIRSQQRDPFQGTEERRVMPTGTLPSQMEIAAAKDAVQRAGVDPKEIDFVLSYSIVPDYLTVPSACAVHEALGLNERCFSIAVDGACNSALLQLKLARDLIASGAARFGLLVQSCNLPALCPVEEPYSAWFGDGATAMVIGPVSDGRGILGQDHRTNGGMYDLMVGGVPGKRWYEDGRTIWYAHDGRRSRQMILEVADRGAEVVSTALQSAQLGAKSVDFYASHQATRWFRAVTQEHCGLDHAKSMDTFRWTASLSACNVPLQLGLAEREGMLTPGETVAMYAGGSGLTWSGIVMRWGR